MTTYPVLPKSYKHAYPFTLSVPSYIYPEALIPNVKMLGNYTDEIEVLLFESAPDSLPTEDEIKTLAMLAKDFDLTYNVHLPADISLTDKEPSVRQQAVKILQSVIHLTVPLSPSTYTVHLPYDEPSRTEADVKKWQEIAYNSMECLLNSQSLPARNFSIETLNYPFNWADKIIKDFGFSVCIDLGHLILYEENVQTVIDEYAEMTSILHLHGVENSRDHIALNRLSKTHSDLVRGILKPFKGVVSLEVFSYKHLADSLIFLEECVRKED
jgi:sugar phosphate isomerase/epimerase